MRSMLSKALLARIIDAYAAKCETLASHDIGESRATFRKRLAQALSPANYSEQYWSSLRSMAPGNKRRLTASSVSYFLAGCRQLLAEELKDREAISADTEITRFEQALRHQFSLFGSGRLTAQDFYFDRRLEQATTAKLFGLPDLLDWTEGGFGFASELRATQDQSIELLEAIARHLGCELNIGRRLKLLEIALSMTHLNHPGSPWHERALELGQIVAAKAHLWQLAEGYGLDDEIKRVATRLRMQLYWTPFVPTLDSPCNYMNYLLSGPGGHAMPMDVWIKVWHSVEHAVIDAQKQVWIDRSHPHALVELVSTLSMKARLLVATGQPNLLREAEETYNTAVEACGEALHDYLLVYPIIKDIVLAKLDRAIDQCERAVERLNAQRHTTATAFAALCVQLTGRSGTGATRDRVMGKLASEAIASPSTVYQYSHVFNANEVNKILAAGD